MKIRVGQKTREPGNSEHGAGQNLLLGVLAALIALLGYLYFFTGLITEREVQQSPAPEAVKTVKQPIPPRPAANEPGTAAPAPQPGKNSLPAAVPADQPKVAAAPQNALPQPSPPVAQQPAKAAAEQQKKPDPFPAQHLKGAGSPNIAKKAAGSRPAAAKAAPEVRYRVVTSGISSQARADAAVTAMKKGGLEHIERKQLTEERTMKRLFVAEFADSHSARAELEKMKKFSAGAFLVTEAGRYALYAGSYDQDSRADFELRRLSGAGVNVVIRKARVAVPATGISAVAADRSRADECVRRLAKLGVPADAKKEAR